jgi:hypothetical protein
MVSAKTAELPVKAVLLPGNTLAIQPLRALMKGKLGGKF